MRESRIYFATRNAGKIREARPVLAEFGLKVRPVRGHKVEVQSRDLQEIASLASFSLASDLGKPILVEDSGLFVSSLGGFPGPFSSFVFETIGCGGILRLVEGVRRDAEFRSVLAYSEPKKSTAIFAGIARGRLATKPTGAKGFGFDPIFVPGEALGRTFAQMELEEKNRFSHRARALRKFCRWYTKARLRSGND